MAKINKLKYGAILRYARLLRENEWRTDSHGLGSWLKHNGFKTSERGPYEGKPVAVGQLFNSVDDYVLENYGTDPPQFVFCAFCDKDGRHRSRGGNSAHFGSSTSVNRWNERRSSVEPSS